MILIAAAVILSFSLSGCVGKEPNEIAYVVALGIDSGDSGNYNITIQYANTTQISGGSSEEGGKNGNQIVEHLEVEAPTIYSAINIANHIVSKNFSLSHAKLIVFSREIAENGLGNIVETFIRSEELRPDVNLAVAVDRADKYLTSIDPVMEVNPAKYYQLIYDKNTLVGIPDGVGRNFFASIKTKNYDCLIPLAGTISSEEEKDEGEKSSGENNGGEGGSDSAGGSDDEIKNEKQQDAPLNNNEFEFNLRDYIGGQAAVEQKNKSEAMGSAVFLNDKMVGILGSIETELFKLLLSDYHYTYLTLFNEETPSSPITVKVMQERRTKYKIDCDEKNIKIKMFLEGDIYSLPANYHIENNIVEFEKNSKEYIEKSCEEFMTSFLKKYNSDIFRIKEKAKKEFLTNKEYNEYLDTVDLRDYTIDVETHFRIRRTGLIVRE